MEFEVHLMLYLIVINLTCDVLRLILRRLVYMTDILEERLGLKFPSDEGRNKFDFSKIFTPLMSGKAKVFKLFKILFSGVVFILELVLPYYLFGRFNKFTGANFEDQVNSFAPFSVVKLQYPPVIEPEPQTVNSEGNRAVEHRSASVAAGIPGSTGEGGITVGEDVILPIDMPKTDKKEPIDHKALTSFNRFLSFSLSKMALANIYIAINAIVAPQNHLYFLKTYIKRQRV